MDLAESKEHLRKISVAVPSGQWDKDLTSAVQRALAEFFLLNPNDDVDGAIGPARVMLGSFFKKLRAK